jgi:hypothetical protein
VPAPGAARSAAEVLEILKKARKCEANRAPVHARQGSGTVQHARCK